MADRILPLLIVLALVLMGCSLATKAPPIANAGPDVTVRMVKASYDGSGSVDLDGGKIVYYQWYIRAAPEGRDDKIGLVIREDEDAAT